MKLKNFTTIPDELLREIIRFVCPSGVTNLRIEVRNTKRTYGGAAYVGCKRVGLRFQPRRRYPTFIHPYQYAQHKGRKYYIANLAEMIVYIAAHELRHMWQHLHPRGWRAWGSRGRYSEVDTEAYAIKMLRAWRRRLPDA